MGDLNTPLLFCRAGVVVVKYVCGNRKLVCRKANTGEEGKSEQFCLQVETEDADEESSPN